MKNRGKVRGAYEEYLDDSNGDVNIVFRGKFIEGQCCFLKGIFPGDNFPTIVIFTSVTFKFYSFKTGYIYNKMNILCHIFQI